VTDKLRIRTESYADFSAIEEVTVAAFETLAISNHAEPGPTTHTTWMPVRHKILRHIDAAFEIRVGRSVSSFFVLEGGQDGDIPPSRGTLESVPRFSED
jgi:hypothetical protein